MAVVSHLSSFYGKVSETGVIRMNHACLCLGLPIS